MSNPELNGQKVFVLTEEYVSCDEWDKNVRAVFQTRADAESYVAEIENGPLIFTEQGYGDSPRKGYLWSIQYYEIGVRY